MTYDWLMPVAATVAGFAAYTLARAGGAAEAYRTRQDAERKLALAAGDREESEYVEGLLQQAAIEAVLTAEEFGRRGGQRGLAKVALATEVFERLVKDADIEVKPEEVQARLDAALTRVRPNLLPSMPELDELAVPLGTKRDDDSDAERP